MIKRLIPTLSAVAILLLGACSTNKLAQQEEVVDDAYYTEAAAKEQAVYAASTRNTDRSSDYVTDDELYGDYDNRYDDRDDYYDRNYSARIYRFRNYSPWRSYYDTWYDYRFDPFYSNFNTFNYYNGLSFNIGFGRPYGYNFGYNNYYNPWNYYGSQYNGGFWGPYSYYNSYNPYFYGGRYGNYYGGNYGNIGRPVIVNPNYRARPDRETENVRSGIYNPSSGGDRIGTSPARPERISTSPATSSGDNTQSIPERSQPVGSSRPSRGSDSQPDNTPRERTGTRETPPPTREARPSRPQRETPPPRTETRPAERQSSPPSSAPSRSSGGETSRPTRRGNQ